MKVLPANTEPHLCTCGLRIWSRHRRCNGCRLGRAGPRVRMAPSLCACGQPKERPAKTCRACYMAFRKSGLWAAAQAAAALESYWEQPA